jgi:hypothetical protein
MSRENRSILERLMSWRILEHVREERRRIPRRAVNIPARIEAGGTVHACTVVDISELGAKLAVELPDALPDWFTILLSPSGHPARRCRVVWRSGENVGVEFLGEHSSEHHPSEHHLSVH